MQLRWYQQQAVEAVWDYLRNKDGSPCVVLPTGSGKTPVLSELCRQVMEWGGRTLVLAHVKELVQQAQEKLAHFVDSANVGVYSAGLNERTTDKPIIVASIQSVYKRAEELGEFHLIVIDEAHLIPPSGTGRYRQLLESEKKVSPKARLVGLTATPYRLGCGWITKDRVEQLKAESESYDRLLDAIAYEVSVDRLISDGTLSSVVSRNARKRLDLSGVHITRGDFDEVEVEKVLNRSGVLESVCAEIVKETENRNKVVVFCNRRESARRCAKLIREYAKDYDVAVVDGETTSLDRDEIIRRFKSENGDETLLGVSKPLKFICNVNVLTTGFDAPNVDCVALLRPTQSLSLYQQMVGRGLRRSSDKADCLVLDYGGNIERHGPIDLPNPDALSKSSGNVKPWRVCPACNGVINRAFPICPLCGEPLEIQSKKNKQDPNAKLSTKADTRSILSNQESEKVEDIVDEYEILKVDYEVHYKKNADDKPPTLQVRYYRGTFARPLCEWLCVEHDGWARKRFEKWWKQKSKTEPPKSVETASLWANEGALATPLRIRTITKPGDNFPRIEWIEMGAIPDFDPRSITSFEDEFFSDSTSEEAKIGFSEFDEYEPTQDCVCGDCVSWGIAPSEPLGGYCVRLDVSKRFNDESCDKYTQRDETNDCPF